MLDCIHAGFLICSLLSLSLSRSYVSLFGTMGNQARNLGRGTPQQNSRIVAQLLTMQGFGPVRHAENMSMYGLHIRRYQ